MDSSNVSEDGASERVRFDSTVCYVLDNNKKEYLDKVSNNRDTKFNQFIAKLIFNFYCMCLGYEQRR